MNSFSHIILFFLYFVPFSSAFADEHTGKIQTTDIALGLALFSPIDATPKHLNVIHNFVLSVFYGQVYGLNGVALSTGVQNFTDTANGLQISGIGSLAGSRLLGAQVSGLFNSVDQNSTGAQIAPANFTGGSLKGAQLGFYNHVKDATGIQIGVINIAKNVTGLQLGLVNIASEINGAQIGLINVADDVTGVPFGLLSIVKRGQFKLFAEGGNISQPAIGLRAGSRYVYGTAAAVRAKTALDEDVVEWRSQLGVGGRIPLTEELNLHLEVVNQGPKFEICFSIESAECEDSGNRPSLRALLAFPLIDAFEVYAGGGFIANSGFKGVSQASFLIGVQNDFFK